MENFMMKKAFTIIEVILVLGISGLMLATMLVGWNASIEKQRYNDSVNTFKSDIQGVFSDVENQTNDKGSTKIKCDTSGANISILKDNSGKLTGSSNCVILGKYISLYNGNVIPGNENATLGQERFRVFDVIGKDIDISKDCRAIDENGKLHGDLRACRNSIEALRATKFVLDGGKNSIKGPKDIELQWRGTYKNVTDNRITSASGRRAFSDKSTVTSVTSGDNKWHGLDTITGVLILRSPIDNSIISFGTSAMIEHGSLDNDGLIAAFRDINVNSDFVIKNGKTVNVCVRPSNDGVQWYAGGFNFFGDRNKVVKIGPSASAVEIAPLDGPKGSSCGGDRKGDARFGDVIIDGKNL